MLYLVHCCFDALVEPSRHMNLPPLVHPAMPPFLPEHGVFFASAGTAAAMEASIAMDNIKRFMVTLRSSIAER
jgi:hypothetical protein